MNQNLIYFFIAISLSMDAFSLALVYGTKNIKEKTKLLLSITVGIFHFIMPFLGTIIGSCLFFKYINISDYIIGIIFIILGLEMLLEKDKTETFLIKNFLSIIFFAFTVSIDSFSIGIALSLKENNLIMAYIIFSITSFFFTYLGVKIGKSFSKHFQKKANILGALILIILGIKYIFFNK